MVIITRMQILFLNTHVLHIIYAVSLAFATVPVSYQFLFSRNGYFVGAIFALVILFSLKEYNISSINRPMLIL